MSDQLIHANDTVNLVLIQPEGYAHSGALAELVETLIYGLYEAGVAHHFSFNELNPLCTNIVIGAHLLDEKSLHDLPAETIIYNSEQIDEKSTWINSDYLGVLRRCRVWDYSDANIEKLRSLSVSRIQHVPVGYVPQLTRIPRLAQQDIDVLFYGAINERRKNILEALISRGLRIEFLSGVYREERDHYIARAKLVINLHYYGAAVFETVRVSYLLANEVAVVTELDDSTKIDPDLREAVCGVPYERLADACVELINDTEKRAALARRGFELFSRHKETSILRRALGMSDEIPPHYFPKTLNLCNEKNWRDDCLNLDPTKTGTPDALFDITRPLDEILLIDSARFGPIFLKENTFDAIIADDVCGNIPDLVTTIGNCLYLLKAGGYFHIHVRHELSQAAEQSAATHAFNEHSWRALTDEHWHYAWTQARFEQVALDFHLSESGQTLHTAGRPLAEILRTPRAVDGMSVTLRKRYLLESEMAQTAAA